MSKITKPTEKKKNFPSARMEQFGLIHPHSAGIDVGSMLMVVSYTNREGVTQLKEYNSFTESLQEMATTLYKEGVKKVTMEATGSYWMALYRILESNGLEVIVVNPSHYKNVDAQKTDVNDAQWLHQLLAHGLIRSSHVASELYRELRGYIHEREVIRNQKSDTLNRIHKTLTLMNIKFQHLVSDIEGVEAMKLLRAIAGGDTNAEKLMLLIDVKKLKSRPQDLLSSLNGDYRTCQINILARNLKMYDFLKEQMKSYEVYIEEVLKKLLPENAQGEKPVIEKKTVLVRKNQYGFNLKSYLYYVLGVDVSKVEGLDEINLLTIMSITGTNMKKWPSAGHFVSWLNLSPRPRISGGKVIGYQKRFNNNSATQAFRLAAQTLWQSKGPLGHQYRKLAVSKGSKKAIKALARRLAVIYYNMVLKQEAYDTSKIKVDEAKERRIKIRRLQNEAAKYGLTLNPIT